MSGVVEPNLPGQIQSSPEGSEYNLPEENEPRVVFNEQTNYVPKRTIITVSESSIPINPAHKIRSH